MGRLQDGNVAVIEQASGTGRFAECCEYAVACQLQPSRQLGKLSDMSQSATEFPGENNGCHAFTYVKPNRRDCRLADDCGLP